MNESELQAALDEACRKHNVPGASAAIFVDDRLALAASGITNVTTGVEMTKDSVMHIGSITKVINATLLMQLVEQGMIALECPVTQYLPAFRVSSAVATRAITVEMLVNHTSGIDGDLLPDLGHDAETIGRTVQRFVNLGQIHEPGHGRSYCNPGTVIAGYLSQRLTGSSWYSLMKERIFKPLGMEHAVVLPEDALLHRAAVGHFLDPASRRIARTSHAFLPLGYAPAGSTAMMNAGDLLTFARMHMANGVAPGGKRIISSQTSQRMRQRSGPLDGPQAFDSGLGWRLNGELVMHGGGGPGIVALLVAHPTSQTAAAVLTNAEHGYAVAGDIIGPLFKEHAGAQVFAPLPPPTGAAVDVSRYTGVYQSINTVHEVEARDGELLWSSYSTQKYYDSSPMSKPEPTPLTAAGNDRFLADSRASTMPTSDTALISFLEQNSRGRMQYLLENYWLFPRKIDSAA